MTTAGSSRAALAVCLLAWLTTRPAHADDAAAAQAAFDEGVRLRGAGHWREACVAFKRSLDLDAQLGTRFNLAGCYQQTGDLVRAWTLYTELAQRDTNAGRKARSAQLAAEIKTRLSWLRIDVGQGNAQLTITVDGEEVTRALGLEVPLVPGAHEITASAPGRLTWKRVMTLAEREHASLTIPLLVETSPLVETSASAAPTPRAPPGAAKVPSGTGRGVFGRVTATVGMYSAPPEVSMKPAFAAGVGGAVGITVFRGDTSVLGAAAIGNADLIVDRVTFARGFLGAGATASRGRLEVQLGPGLALLTGAGDTVLGFGGDLAATFIVSGHVGVSLNANLSSMGQPAGLTGRLTVLRTAVGVSFQL